MSENILSFITRLAAIIRYHISHKIETGLCWQLAVGTPTSGKWRGVWPRGSPPRSRLNARFPSSDPLQHGLLLRLGSIYKANHVMRSQEFRSLLSL